ncbi:transmembrane protein 45A-like [Dasypus novemcinctus]|uniref:transmembrane protein 45A-like n=1 Tax=Dasypus novemcinctus TaxID=9361 RepID=UPI0003288C74|nr:transmembrane protein 45A-like [Dasypus novemcinctus]
MGSFRGHALPGICFLIMGLWWNTKNNLKYACKKYKRTCYLDSKALFHRLEILEGLIIIIMSLTGLVGEQFIPGGPYLTLYDYKEGQWNQLLEWQHCTMYFFYGLLGVSEILCLTISSLPISITRLMLSNALFVEAFVFYNHTHGREMLDLYVHQLLVLIIIVAGLLAFMYFFMRSNIVLELLLSSLILFQGSWFWQIGFVLYPPNGSPEWDQRDHDNMMFITICFCWHYAVTLLIGGVNFVFVTWLVKSRLKRFCSSEVGLLKNAEREQESEEEM